MTSLGTVANTILVIDGDAQVKRFVRVGLERRGYLMHQARSGGEGIATAVQVQPKLIILAPALPDISGMYVLNVIRSRLDVPVVILATDDSEDRKVKFLKAGADDYIVRPCGINELAARCEAIMRRWWHNVIAEHQVVSTGPLMIDLRCRSVSVNGTYIALTRQEYHLLRVLASHLGLVVAHDQLTRAIWKTSSSLHRQYLRTLVHKLRQKLEVDPARPRLVIAEENIGYLLPREVGCSVPAA
jgi:two-component system KDP operon response regulator KdpE